MPFTYLIGWSKLDQFYYGARWASNSNPDDLWTIYFTSSKHVKRFRELHGEPDIILIKKLFDTVNECRNYEERVLRKLKVTKNNRWLNKGYSGKYLPAGPKTAEHQKKISIALTGKKRGPPSKESNEKRSRATKGVSKKFTEEHKAALKCHEINHSIITCPHCNMNGQYRNMKQWHFENCNTIKERPKFQCLKCNRVVAKNVFSRYHGENCKF